MEANVKLNNLDGTAKVPTIQDYILKPAAITKETNYTVILQNNTDFIVRRTTEKTVRELVFLVSQGQFYIKEKDVNTVLTRAKLSAFLRDLKDDLLTLESVYWMENLSINSLDDMCTIMDSPLYADVCRHGVLRYISFDKIPYFAEQWQQNKKLFLQAISELPDINNCFKNQQALYWIFEIEKRYGYNEAIYFLSKVKHSGMEDLSPYYNNHLLHPDIAYKFLELMQNPQYNLNLRRLIDYILFDIYKQGIYRLGSSFWNMYSDYLKMQLQFYGKVKEKYPENLKTEHDKISLKVQQADKFKKSEKFLEKVSEAAHMEFSQGRYCIKIPQKPQELAEESVTLGHSVGSYVSRVIKGECQVAFLRKKQSPDHPLVTISISGRKIDQVEGQNHRRPTKEENSFLKKWAEEKGLLYDAA